MATVKQLYDLLDRKAPFRTQMDFDNAGFLVGRGDRTVTRVLVALDITPEVIAEAAEKGCQLILAHHPVIWGKLGQVTDESATGRKVLALIEKAGRSSFRYGLLWSRRYRNIEDNRQICKNLRSFPERISPT